MTVLLECFWCSRVAAAVVATIAEATMQLGWIKADTCPCCERKILP
jgi:hypothetical protein